MYTKNSAFSQLITAAGPKSQVADFPAIKNETANSGIPEAARHRLI